jgi:transmembrane sensor
MDTKPLYNELPWELMVAALRGEQSPDEERLLREWLDVSENNREQFRRLQEMWNEGLSDHGFYEQADEIKGWEALQDKLTDSDAAVERESAGVEGGRIVQGNFGRKKHLFVRWAVAAVVMLIAAGAGWWYMSGKGSGGQYATGAGERRTISLPDGSTVILDAGSRMRLSDGFNEASRMVTLISGSARFSIAHQQRLPFIVDMDIASVRDIGTVFTVERTKDSIKVAVSEGRVAFTDKKTGETREASAGGVIDLDIAGNRITVATSLRFDNARLSDVIDALQESSGKKIVLADMAMAGKRLTVHLDGESFEDAIATVCASLDLYYTVENGSFVLRGRK